MVKVDSEKKCLQALLNILSNALRHAAHAIDISILERERQVWIDIKDDGEGIPEEVLPNLFQRFFFKGKNGENGLGLAISRAIIEQSGGSIAAWNDQDGALFFFGLCCRPFMRKESEQRSTHGAKIHSIPFFYLHLFFISVSDLSLGSRSLLCER